MDNDLNIMKLKVDDPLLFEKVRDFYDVDQYLKMFEKKYNISKTKETLLIAKNLGINLSVSSENEDFTVRFHCKDPKFIRISLFSEATRFSFHEHLEDSSAYYFFDNEKKINYNNENFIKYLQLESCNNFDINSLFDNFSNYLNSNQITVIKNIIDSGENYQSIINIDNKLYVLKFDKIDTLNQNGVLCSITPIYSNLEKVNERNRKKILENFIKKKSDANIKCAYLLLDLNNFRKINESFGHKMGDEILERLEYKIKTILDNDEYVTRINSDEFSIILNIKSRSILVKRIKELLDILSEPIKILDSYHMVTSNIGVAINSFGKNFDNLHNEAYFALRSSKEKKENHFAFYELTLMEEYQEKIEIERDLKFALKKGELSVFYQPQISFKEEKMFSVEALIRWKHPIKGFISPAIFIPIAEETGLILEIGRFVSVKAINDIKFVRRKFDIKLAVNLSSKQFKDKKLFRDINELLKDEEENFLECEITERLAIDDYDQNLDIMNQLKKLDMEISLDDFGTGYSSLSYLKTLPIDTIKLDKAFVENFLNDKSDMAILKTIIALGKNLDKQIIAEGVETIEQVTSLISLGVDRFQGYYFDKALQISDLLENLENNKYVNMIKKIKEGDINEIKA